MTAMREGDFDFYALWSKALEVLLKEFVDLIVVLVRHKSAREFGVSLRGEYRLRAFADVAAPNAANVKTWAATVALDGGITFFSA